MARTRAEIIATGRACSCGEPATQQTVRGEEAESGNHLPQNHGYYCDACYADGLQIEKEAMYRERELAITMTERAERFCECFGDSGLCASTFGDSRGRRCCDLCGWPVKFASFDGLKTVNPPRVDGETGDEK